MENFRRQFTLEAVETLENLLKDLQSAGEFSDSKRREIFRTLHTVKGTAQTFGFTDSSRLAHELETLLSGEKKFQKIFLEGIALLIKSLTEKNFEMPEQFAGKLRRTSANDSIMRNDADDFSPEIPNEFFSRLSHQEKIRLRSATRARENLYVLEIGFSAANFADGLINFREALSESGEIIATFPGAKFNAGGEIGFCILLASPARIAEIKTSGAAAIFQYSPDDFPKDFKGAAAQVIRHGAAIAEKFGKRIRFEVRADEINLPPRELKLVFDVLLHLVRNAIDHAIESEGEIKIELKIEDEGFRLIVADDGRGIDTKKIKAKAIEKKLIADVNLTERETLDLIFLPEFSTKSAVTEISGRGIGLDAVKNAVERANGKIAVETRKGKGATFDIFFPNKQ